MEKSIKIKVKNSYFVIAENILFDKYAGKIGPDAVFLYLFFKRIGANERIISVSYKYITKKMGWRSEKISKLLNKLIEVNLVEKRKTTKANVYIIADVMAENIAYYTASGEEKKASPPEKNNETSPDATPLFDEKYEEEYGDELPDSLKPSPEKETEEPENNDALFENRTAPFRFSNSTSSKIEDKDRYRYKDIHTNVCGKPQELSDGKKINLINELVDVKYAWRGVVVEYLARTKHSLTEKDIKAIDKLDKLHKPAVVLTQFRKLWNRMKYEPGKLDKLNFSYIYATLKNWSSLKKNKKQEAKNAADKPIPYYRQEKGDDSKLLTWAEIIAEDTATGAKQPAAAVM